MEEKNFEEYVENLKLKMDMKKDVIFFCIGTDRVIGDCLGPITGSFLKNMYDNEKVFGDLDNNLTYENILKKIDEINLKFEDPYIVAIDAALSSEDNIGKIFVDEEGIKGLVQKLTDLINNDGKVEKVDELGKKKLAYEIQKNKEGYYVVFNFEANPDLISELERNYRITDEVIKFMTIKVEE